MTEFNRTLLSQLRVDMNAALAAVAAKHGISINVGSGSFSAATASFKLDLANVAAGDGASSGEAIQTVKARADWDKQCRFFGLQKEWLGQSFERNGETVTILGLMPTRTKYPVLVQIGQKRIVLQAEDVVLRMLAKAKVAAAA